MKRFPRHARFPRPVKRWQRCLQSPDGKRFPREPMRFPKIARQSEFIPLYKLQTKPKDQYPDLYKELQELKDKFLQKNRKLSVYCPRSKDRHCSGLEVCLCRCKKKCDAINFRNLVGPSEGPSDYMDDFIKFQRICNIIYGTVRQKDIKPE